MFLSPRVFSFKRGKQRERGVTSVHWSGSSPSRSWIRGLAISEHQLNSSPKGLTRLCYSTRPLNALLCGLSTRAGETGFIWTSLWQPGLSMLYLNGRSQNIFRGTCPILIIFLSVQVNCKKSINSLITPTDFVYITDETSGSIPWRSIN